MSISDFYVEVAELAGLDACDESTIEVVAQACGRAFAGATPAEIAVTVQREVIGRMMDSVR